MEPYTFSKEIAVDDYALKPVKESEKRGVLQLSLVTAGYCMATSGLFTGAAIAAGLSLWDAIIATLIGSSILTICAGLIGAAGAKHGVSTVLLARHAFGRSGAKIIGALWAFTLLGWFAVQTGFFGQTIHAMMPDAGFLAYPKVAALWGGLLMMLTAYLGYKGIEALSIIAIPALVQLAMWGVHATVSRAEGWENLFAIVPHSPISFTEGVVLIVGSFVVGAVIQADISRYAKTQASSWLASIVGYIFGNSFMIIAGCITALATGSGDLPAAMIATGLSIPALVIVIAAQWTTNDNNLYSASLALSNILKMKKSQIVLMWGLIASFLGLMGIANYFIPWLNILGILIPPVAGVLIADYYFIQKEAYHFGPGTEYSQYAWPAFASWACGIAAGVLLPVGIPSITAICAAFAAHIILNKLCETCRLSSKYGLVLEDSEGF